jgi:hypothetical protein
MRAQQLLGVALSVVRDPFPLIMRRRGCTVQACVAYNQITIPSILDTMQQIRLYLVSAQVSLQNGLSQQAEALLRSALAAVAEALGTGESGRRVLERLGPSHEAEFVEWVRALIGFLVVMPGSPEPKKGPFYIIKGLLKILDDFPWKEGGDGQVCALAASAPGVSFRP